MAIFTEGNPCSTCKHDQCNQCPPCGSQHGGWEPIETIKGVASEEITTNEAGGKQSALPYRFDLIDAKAMFALAGVMYEGTKKYDVDNWRKISVDEHLNHAESHIWAHKAGDKQDSHLSHAYTRMMMALAVSLQNKP